MLGSCEDALACCLLQLMTAPVSSAYQLCFSNKAVLHTLVTLNWCSDHSSCCNHVVSSRTAVQPYLECDMLPDTSCMLCACSVPRQMICLSYPFQKCVGSCVVLLVQQGPLTFHLACVHLLFDDCWLALHPAPTVASVASVCIPTQASAKKHNAQRNTWGFAPQHMRAYPGWMLLPEYSAHATLQLSPDWLAQLGQTGRNDTLR